MRILSTATKGFTKTTPIGTEKYMAPEIMRGTVSPKGDVYALGVVRCVCAHVCGMCVGIHVCVCVCLQVLLELLVNKTIFQQESVVQLDTGILTADSIMDLDLGWTVSQSENLLHLADTMTNPQYKQRPTAKQVGRMDLL